MKSWQCNIILNIANFYHLTSFSNRVRIEKFVKTTTVRKAARETATDCISIFTSICDAVVKINETFSASRKIKHRSAAASFRS